MSYNQTFHADISVSGLVTVNYPPSKDGGSTTVRYNDIVPVDWTVHVDTEPFENSVRETETALDVLAGSVVALNAAQVKSIQTSSQKVAKTLSSGFFNLIGKDLSKNMVTQINTVRAKFALLMQYSKDLIAKQERMGEDIARLQRHYYNIFHNLDEDLNHRITALDRPAFAIGHGRRDEILQDPYLEEAVFCLKGLNEGDRAANLLVNARTNRSVSSLVSSLYGYVWKKISYQRTLSGVLERNTVDTGVEEYIPVIVVEGKGVDDSGSSFFRCVPPDMSKSAQVAESVFRYVQGMQDSLWNSMDHDQLEIIDRNFCNYVEQDSQTDQNPNKDRIHQMVMKMWSCHKNSLRDLKER